MSTTDRLLEELVDVLTPVYLALQSPAGLQRLLRRLGHDPTAASAEAALDAVTDAAAGLATLIETLGEKAWTNQPVTEADHAAIARDVPGAIQALRDLPELFQDVALGPRFFAEVLDLLFVDYLEFRAPAVLRALVLLGVVERELLTPGEDPDARAVEFERLHIRWERFRRFLQAPSDIAEEVYGLGGPDFEAVRLLTNLALFIDELGILVLPAQPPGGFADQVDAGPGNDPPLVGIDVPLHRLLLGDADIDVGLLALPLKGRAAPVENDRGIGVMPYVAGVATGEFPVTEDGEWVLHVEAGAEVAGGMVFRLHPSGLHLDVGILDGTATAGRFRIELRRVTPAGGAAMQLLGDPEGTRLEAQGLGFGVGGDDGDFYLAVAIERLQLVLDVSGDALLSQAVPEPIEVDIGDVVAGWRLGRGIYLEQGSGLRLRVPLDVRAGGVRLRQLGIELELTPEVALTTLVSGDLSIGPLSLSIEELGFRVEIRSDPDGPFGPFDLGTGVRFPTGYGAQLAAGPISGGGFLDRADHEYRGALALRFESFGLAAFAVLTTRLPGGAPGFSFLATIFGDVDVQLGYGFRLTGIGGIIAIDRGVDVAALQAALSAGQLDSVLFPRAPIRDAAVILDNLAAIFPQRPGQYLVGPMVRIAWGTPTLIEGKVGVVLELSRQTRAVVLGSIVAALPVRSAAIVVLQVDFVGTIEFATGAVGFDARLTNSRILSWPVSGEAAVRTGWGRSVGLVASIGGFHPEFSPPPGFPSLQPMTIDFATDNPRLTLTAYLALTLNTVQAGALASLYVKGPKIIFVGRFAVEGSAGFDALISFDPFAFDAKLWLGLKLLLDGDVICGIGGDLRLRGPNRYEISGKVWASVLGVTVKVKVNESWGNPVTEAPQLVDGGEILRAAVQSATGFEPIPVPTRVSGVGFAGQRREEQHELIDPSGGVRFLQRAVPLAVPIDHIGTAWLASGTNTFDLAFSDGGAPISGRTATSDFVRGAYFDLSESQRLHGPATEPHKAGIELSGPDDLVFDENAARSFGFAYETVFIGGDGEADDAPAVDDHLPDPVVIDRFIRLIAARRSTPLNDRYVPEALLRDRIAVRRVSYVVVAESAVDAGPEPARAPDGTVVTGPLSAMVSGLRGNERAIAGYLAAPAG